jgi:glycosyltransferase involved in cell wall biosynthesis
VYDILAGGRLAARLVRRHGYTVVHGRALVATAMGTIAKRQTGCQLVFDIRGFNPEEYVDAGVWQQGGLKYRLAKRAEKKLLAAADGFVVLTERAREILFPGCGDCDERGRPIKVIPCCVDMGRFPTPTAASRRDARESLGLSGRRVFVYVGALGGFYLTREMAEFLAVAHRRDRTTFSLILTQSAPEPIARALRDLGVQESDCLIRRVSPTEIPWYLQAADFAVSFIKPSFSKAASSPTKIAEYLASGLPVLSNTNIGDLDALIEDHHVGILIRHFDERHYHSVLDDAEALARDPELALRCRDVAATNFDLETVGGERYRALYASLEEAGKSILGVS